MGIKEIIKDCTQRRVVIILMLIAVLALASGCLGIIHDNNSSKSNSSSTPDTTPSDLETETSIQSSTSTPSVTSSPIPQKTVDKKDKYEFFREGYVGSVEEYNISVLKSDVDSKNSRLSITYEMEDPDDDMTVGAERENITITYAVAVKYFIENNRTHMNESWAPKYLNVTAVTSEGRIYETAHTTRQQAKRWINGELSTERYVAEYYGTIEPGPANSNYEG